MNAKQRELQTAQLAKDALRTETGRFHSADAVVSEALTLLEKRRML